MKDVITFPLLNGVCLNVTDNTGDLCLEAEGTFVCGAAAKQTK